MKEGKKKGEVTCRMFKWKKEKAEYGTEEGEEEEDARLGKRREGGQKLRKKENIRIRPK